MKQEETTQGPSVHTSKGLRSICSALTNGTDTDTDTDPCLFLSKILFLSREACKPPPLATLATCSMSLGRANR